MAKLIFKDQLLQLVITEELKNVVEDMRNLTQESMVMLIVDCDFEVIKKQVISLGSSDMTIVDQSTIFKAVLKEHRAYGIILIHNHLSSNIEPSDADIISTKKYIEGCELLNISFIDHLIVATKNEKVYSFRQNYGINNILKTKVTNE